MCVSCDRPLTSPIAYSQSGLLGAAGVVDLDRLAGLVAEASTASVLVVRPIATSSCSPATSVAVLERHGRRRRPRGGRGSALAPRRIATPRRSQCLRDLLGRRTAPRARSARSAASISVTCAPERRERLRELDADDDRRRARRGSPARASWSSPRRWSTARPRRGRRSAASARASRSRRRPPGGPRAPRRRSISTVPLAGRRSRGRAAASRRAPRARAAARVVEVVDHLVAAAQRRASRRATR